jgi:hypothetical protein
MKRFWLYNGLVTAALFLTWFWLNATHVDAEPDIAYALFGIFFLGFYGSSLISLRSRFPDYTVIVALLSAIAWSIASVAFCICVLLQIFGGY